MCETATCLNLSLSVTSYLDLDTPPCTDFYKFACGSWSQENPIPPGHVSFDTLQKVAKGNTVRLYQVRYSQGLDCSGEFEVWGGGGGAQAWHYITFS